MVENDLDTGKLVLVLQLIILGRLGATDLGKVMQTCQHFNHIGRDQSLWKRLLHKDFNGTESF